MVGAELVARADAARLRGWGSSAIPPRIGRECPNNGLSPITRPGSENFTHIVTSGLGHPSGRRVRGHPGARFSRMNCAERMWGASPLVGGLFSCLYLPPCRDFVRLSQPENAGPVSA